MPEHLRALVVILILAGSVFALARAPVTAQAMAPEDFRRRRNLWFAITLIAYLAHSFWLFMAIAGVVLAFAGRREHNPMALFAFLLFAVPPFHAALGGLGIIKQVLTLDFPRLLAITLLLPAFFRIRRQAGTVQRRWGPADYLVIGYLLVQLGLRYQVDSWTNTARYAIYSLLDVWLPYYVASRSLRDVRAFRDVAMSLICASMVVALVAVFETVRHWLLYVPLEAALDAQWGLGNYLGRGSFLRAQGPAGQPIVLGYLMVVALALYPYLRRSIPMQPRWWLGFALLLAGLVASFSRGPWVAALVALMVFRFSTPKAVGGSLKAAAVVGAIVLVAMASPFGAAIRDYLPFVGTIEVENVDYRQHLLEASIQIILQNPLFGSTNYMYSLINEDLTIGGMVDVVNTYLAIGLSSGLVGLGCFAGAFGYALVSVVRGMRRLPDRDDEQHTLGSGVLACMVGVMVTIFTVSSISLIPVVYWAVLGLAVGYARLSVRTAGVEASSLVAGRLSPRAGLAAWPGSRTP